MPALLNSIVHDPGDLVRADGSRPETIDFLQRRGFGVRAARKGAGSVREGIARLQSFELLVDPGCENVRSELRQYSWPTDRLTGQVVPGVNPIGVADHCIDAIRYSVEDLIPGASFNDDPDDDGGALLIPMWGSARARERLARAPPRLELTPMGVLVGGLRRGSLRRRPDSLGLIKAVDFSRFAPDKRAVWIGNVWGLPVNLILFSFVAGITTTAAYAVYHEALLHPDEISARFDNWFLALLAALTFAVATLGINVVANFVSPAFDFANVFPSMIDFKKGGYIAALIALVLYPFAPWEGSAATFVGVIGSTMGPVFGVILVDYYLIRNGEIDVPELYREEGAYRYTNGWNYNAVAAAVVGAVFSSVLPNFTNVLPSWWGVYGWFFGVAIGGAVYYALVKARGAPAPRAARAA